MQHTSSGSSDFIKLQPGVFCDIFRLLLSKKDAVLRAAKGLLVPACKNNRLVFNEEEKSWYNFADTLCTSTPGSEVGQIMY